jgi:glycerol-3-phosphate dehydrogenase
VPKPNFVNCAGIESPGLSASPAIALYIVDLLKDQGLNFEEKENYNPKRVSSHLFHDASIDEKNEMIKQNPSYGKIVCRCEGVTEGEILNALRTNPKARDLDGVKRRTRAQMGRCQGGFCTPYITELIAKELNVPFEAVTKFGGKSVINLGKTKGGR